MLDCAKQLEKRLKDRIKENEIKFKDELYEYQIKEEEWKERETKLMAQIKEQNKTGNGY